MEIILIALVSIFLIANCILFHKVGEPGLSAFFFVLFLILMFALGYDLSHHNIFEYKEKCFVL